MSNSPVARQPFRRHRARRVNVDIRERLNESFGMAKRNAGVMLRDFCDIIVSPLVNLLGAIRETDVEVIRILLLPI